MMLISHFENHWFRELRIVLVAGGRRQGVERDTEGRSLRSRVPLWRLWGPLAGFPEDSDGPPFVFWKDPFGCDVEDASVVGPG